VGAILWELNARWGLRKRGESPFFVPVNFTAWKNMRERSTLELG